MKATTSNRTILTLFKRMLFLLLIGGGCTLAGRNAPPDDFGALEESAAFNDAALVSLIRKSAHRLSGNPADYDPLLKTIGDSGFVLLGEATHGTHEFYRERAALSRRLVEEKGFSAIVLEADWTDAYRINEFVQGRSADRSAEQSLAGFTRFPEWMWRNAEMRDFVASIRSFNNAARTGAPRVGIYGMDLYALTESADAVVKYLNRVDRPAGKIAARRYACFEAYREQPEKYGLAVSADQKKSCETAAFDQFQEMESRYRSWLSGARRQRDEDLFSAYQNARVVKNGESYYRLSFKGNFSTWNLRDSHMAETLRALAGFLEASGGTKSKIVVWAHNTHQGDARMTEMGEQGELNVGHLMRQSNDGNSFLVGLTTYTGEVTAASEWGEKGEKRKVRPALPESYSGIFHETGISDFLLIFRGNEPLTRALDQPRPERAIGVIYKTETERQSHYFNARMSRQFDAVLHFDVTKSVTPIDR